VVADRTEWSEKTLRMLGRFEASHQSLTLSRRLV
jgi:hypothetical protein